MATTSSKKTIKVAHFKIADEGYFRGVVVDVKHPDSRDIRRRLEVVDVEELVEDPVTGNRRVDPRATKDGSLQTFVGEEIEELFIEELCPREHGTSGHLGVQKGGMTGMKRGLRARDGDNAHLRDYVGIDYNKICLAGRSSARSGEPLQAGPSTISTNGPINGHAAEQIAQSLSEASASNGDIDESANRFAGASVGRIDRPRTHASSVNALIDGSSSSSPIAGCPIDGAVAARSRASTTNNSTNGSTSLANADRVVRLRTPEKLRSSREAPALNVESPPRRDNVQDRLLEMSVQPSAEEVHLSQVAGVRPPTDYFVVDRMGGEFSLAIDDVKRNQKEVGVAFSGENLGRHGSLCWVQISTRRANYLFDIVALGADAFKGGLKFILESTKILKVMHDSRRPADNLFHKYHVTLANVFDTMVADAKIRGDENYGHWPLYVRRLGAVLQEYSRHLQLTTAAINLGFVRSRDPSLDERIFRERPATREIEEVLVRDVMYLLPLSSAMKNTILNSVFRASDICLGELRDTRDEIRWGEKNEKQERVPESFQRFTRHTDRWVVNFADSDRRRRVDRDVEERGFYACVPSGSQSLPFIQSHNSVCHGGPPLDEKPVPDHLRLTKSYLQSQHSTPDASGRGEMMKPPRPQRDGPKSPPEENPSSYENRQDDGSRRRWNEPLESHRVSPLEPDQFDNAEDEERSHYLSTVADTTDRRRPRSFSNDVPLLPRVPSLSLPRPIATGDENGPTTPGSDAVTPSSSSSSSSSRSSSRAGRGRGSLLAVVHGTTPPQPPSLATLVPDDFRESGEWRQPSGVNNGDHWRPINLAQSLDPTPDDDRNFSMIP